MKKKKKPMYVELGTKDLLILACIFGAADHFIATVFCLVFMYLSARNERKENEEHEVDSE